MVRRNAFSLWRGRMAKAVMLMLPALLVAVLPALPAAAQQGRMIFPPPSPEEAAGRYVARLFVQQERTWRRILARQGGRAFVPPRLRFFAGEPDAACAGDDGMGDMASFFYCPEDGSIYLNLLALRDLMQARGFDGRLLIAQILAHETGHHVQYLLGLDAKLGGLLSIFDTRRREEEKSHRFELQADCLSGVWARHDGGALTPERFGAALRGAVHDGFLPPEEEASGELTARLFWFRRGYQSGRIGACDTFRN